MKSSIMMRKFLALICVVLFSCTGPTAQTHKEIAVSTFRSVKVGMTKAQVIELLGTPDDSITETHFFSGFTPRGCIKTSKTVHRFVWHGTFMYEVAFHEGKVTRKRKW
jgi:hypothetical protein